MDTTALAQWAAFGAVFIGAIVSVFRPDNTALPFAVPTQARVAIALVLGAVQACLLAIQGGTPWAQAVIASVMSVVAGYAAHGAPRVLVAFLLIVPLSSLTACGLLRPKTVSDIGTAAACIEAHVEAGEGVGQVAVACGVEVAEILDEVLASKKLAVRESPAWHESTRAQMHLVEESLRGAR